MTSIGSATTASFSSPRELLQKELLSEVSSGTVSSGDQTALSTALDDIDAALKSDRASSAGASSSPPSRSDIKSKIDSLIAAEVKKGTLTSSQADELKKIFAKALPAHGPGASGSSQAAGQSDTTGAESSSTDSPTSQLLQDFMKLLKDAQGSTSYSATGESQKSGSALLVSIQS